MHSRCSTSVLTRLMVSACFGPMIAAISSFPTTS